MATNLLTNITLFSKEKELMNPQLYIYTQYKYSINNITSTVYWYVQVNLTNN